MIRKRKHEAEKEPTGFVKTLIIFVIVCILCFVTAIVYVALTGNEKTLHAPTPYASQSKTQNHILPEFPQISASSTRKISNTTYPPENAFDKNRSTAWTPEENDMSPWIRLYSQKEQVVRGIRIEDGYSKSEKLYYENRRAKEIFITCDNDSFKFTLKDQGPGIAQDLGFNKQVKTKNIMITIKNYYEGTVYNDVCITEIEPY